MRTNVSFRHPAPFVPLPDTEDILAVGGTQWFADLLRRVPDIGIDREPCQEDWGVVFFVRRNQVIYVPDDVGDGAFVVTAFDMSPKAMHAYRRRQRRKRR